MAVYAEFGIIDDFDFNKDYVSYEPQKYNCIKIDDDIIEDWFPQIKEMPSYYHNYNRPEYGLARWGITLIPPSSCEMLIDIIHKNTSPLFRNDVTLLIDLLYLATEQNKFVIHYGI